MDDLLETWEGTYKKGLLSFWILLLLDQRPTYAFEMNPLIHELSQNTISADDNSLYRALNRFEQLGLITSQRQPSEMGPARRYYSLTAQGRDLLIRFTQRNLLVFQTSPVADAIQRLMQNGHGEEKKS
ncbi:predicted transcriptional regulator [Longilinea arvoryzae]|uniref:Predicted transcriptional regulator n=1 Tax=Longilinea arvoryzae TaxID=360412 RepID=A0A0S7BFD9_9CHLR|nr:PadR family transcriptional regulator [Longilinea arvoryzae]GAP12357.1 predicted transcriptional regulator [Longilinea arvoryzae]